ncbi:hypothetical protein T01_16222 [Trichinella spiralis]|uniref:Uncharacterized protein n=1 Tax=Trichinella spiralis TaxID=6334 RepID=A0A0V1B7W6_TRISP|nr:hypothetical protein T01_16222 [Trichinella spiralis]
MFAFYILLEQTLIHDKNKCHYLIIQISLIPHPNGRKVVQVGQALISHHKFKNNALAELRENFSVSQNYLSTDKHLLHNKP